MQNFKKNIIFLSVLLHFSFSYSVKDFKILLNTIPKTGTNLVIKCLKLLTNKKHIFYYEIPKNLINQTASHILVCHSKHTLDNVNELKNNKFKIFFTIRDPRDQIISWIYWAYPKFKKPSYHIYNNLTFNQLINELIVNGNAIYNTINPSIKNNTEGISQFYQQYLPWASIPDVYVIRFEKLVGSQGGGDLKDQMQEIKNIAEHIGLNLKSEEIAKIAKKLFGGTPTFLKGQIGSWKKYFTEEHKSNFKKVAGQLLIDLGYEKDLSW